MEDGLKISELTQATTISNADLIPIVQNNETKSVSLIDMIYPIGSIYMSVNNVNPSTLFGGMWEQIKDTFLLSAGDTYTSGNSGGEATHTLTINEMPSHSHSSNINLIGGFTGASANLTTGGDSWSYGSSNFLTNTGGGQAHNNMPPYLVVNVWKRTA